MYSYSLMARTVGLSRAKPEPAFDLHEHLGLARYHITLFRVIW